jgi:hypothetical protein
MKIRHPAGLYDEKTRTPSYSLEVSTWKDLRDRVKVVDFLMGTENKRIWVYEITNESEWPAFISIKRDGQLLTMSGSEKY